MGIEAATGYGRLRVGVLLLPFLLCHCGAPVTHTPAPAKSSHARHTPAQPKLEAAEPSRPDAYILHLSLAQLALENDAGDVTPAVADFNIIRAYSDQKQNGHALQPVIIFEYALNGHATRQLILIPFTMPKETSEFKNLEEVMGRLGDLSYTLYDLRLAVVDISPPEPLNLKSNDMAAAEKAVEDRLRPLIKTAAALPAMAEARIHLQLARFFMQHQYKEPAYLAIENARQSLATVDENVADGASEPTRNLSREIDVQESLLHKTMPFTF